MRERERETKRGKEGGKGREGRDQVRRYFEGVRS